MNSEQESLSVRGGAEKCRLCGTRRYKPPVPMVKLTQEREITLHVRGASGRGAVRALSEKNGLISSSLHPAVQWCSSLVPDGQPRSPEATKRASRRHKI